MAYSTQSTRKDLFSDKSQILIEEITQLSEICLFNIITQIIKIKLIFNQIYYHKTTIDTMEKDNKYDQPFIQFLPFSFSPTFLSTEEWKTSDYGENQQRLLNEEVRKSEYKFATAQLSNLPIHNFNNQGKWRLIRYQAGKFLSHQDQQKDQNHVGTQIIILPKTISPHEKGQLVIFDRKNKDQIIKVQAQPFVYIYVFIPLGYLHQITKVEGVRTVATRMVTGEKKKEKPKQTYEFVKKIQRIKYD